MSARDATQISFQAVARLADKVACGDVVFFIGAGFSVDSEGNTAACLVRRLLLRLLALSRVFGLKGARDGFKHTFGLEAPVECAPEQNAFPFTKKDVEKLAEHYYEVNEWFCATFAAILAELPPEELAAQARRVAEAEVAIARTPGKGLEPLTLALQRSDDLERLLPALVAWARAHPEVHDIWRQAGKSLFLDTLGFRDEQIMRGCPTMPDAAQVLASYGGRILPRHLVLARLAREGLCTTTVTANYDLLLEGAFRVCGLADARTSTAARASQAPLPATEYRDFARIADAVEFFSDGKANRTPVLVKMHGSVDRYRDCLYQPPEGPGPLAYLRSMVFTYREIQNWRGESWASDFLRTMLRTRTVVFSGYSLQDPVVHDTFRTVYEEMASEVRRYGNSAVRASASEEDLWAEAARAPGYFFAPGTDKREFHGLEVLHAASAAVNGPRVKSAHPNYLRFHFRGQPEFPNLDELFVSLQHGVLRYIQRTCLDSQLRRMVAVMLGAPRRREEVQAVIDRFDEITTDEAALVGSWRNGSGALGREQHQRLCGWTDSFLPHLLREFAAVDLLQAYDGPGTQLASLRRVPFHYPASQDPRWTCWAAVLEIAIRRLVRRALGVGASVPDHQFVWSARGIVPTVLFAPPTPPARAPNALAIYLASFDPESQLSRLQGQAIRHCSWQLTSTDALWPRTGEVKAARRRGEHATRTVLHAPPADLVWKWASGPDQAIDEEQARLWLGFPTPKGPQ